MATYTFNLTPYGGRHTGGYQSTPTFSSYSQNYVGCSGSDYSTQYCTGLAGDISVIGNITSINLTVNISSNPYQKEIRVAKKNASGTGSFTYTNLTTHMVARSARSFTVDLTSSGLCEYGYLLYQSSKSYATNTFTVNSATLVIVTDYTPPASIIHVKDNGVMKDGSVYCKQNGSMLVGVVYVKQNGSMIGTR